MRTVACMISILIVALAATIAIASPQEEHPKPSKPAEAPRQAQRPPQPAPPPDIKQSPVAKFVGTWKGTATHSMPGQESPSEIAMVEKVQWALSETALLIEGKGTMADPATAEEKIVHDALGVLRYDPRSHKLVLSAFKVGEPANVSELEILGSGDIRWLIKPSETTPAVVRFTTTLTNDTWREIGEFSPDGNNFHQFMEMNLTRVDED